MKLIKGKKYELKVIYEMFYFVYIDSFVKYFYNVLVNLSNVNFFSKLKKCMFYQFFMPGYLNLPKMIPQQF